MTSPVEQKKLFEVAAVPPKASEKKCQALPYKDSVQWRINKKFEQTFVIYDRIIIVKLREICLFQKENFQVNKMQEKKSRWSFFSPIKSFVLVWREIWKTRKTKLCQKSFSGESCENFTVLGFSRFLEFHFCFPSLKFHFIQTIISIHFSNKESVLAPNGVCL